MRTLMILIMLISISSCQSTALIDKIQNKTVFVDNNWAGKSYTFLKTQLGDNIIVYQEFGSGVRVAHTSIFKYTIKGEQIVLEELLFNSDDKIESLKGLISINLESNKVNGHFITRVSNRPELYKNNEHSLFDLETILNGEYEKLSIW